jgi:hypothetical protein
MEDSMRNPGLVLAVALALAALLWFGLSLRQGAEPALESPPPGPAEPIRAGGGDRAVEPRAAGTLPALGAAPISATATPSGATPSLPPGFPTLSARQLADIVRHQPAPVPGATPGARPARTHAPGQLSPQAVRHGIDAARPAVTRCYDEALRQSPALAGKLLVKFVVAQDDGKGRILEADIEEEGSDAPMLNPFLGMCVLKALGEIEYPVPEGVDGGEGEIVVRFPFQFSASPAKKP